MGYTRFVEIGRVAYIDYGMYRGRLVAIVDVIDQNRALVDGPCSGVPRQSMNFNKLHLTSFVLKLGPSARSGTVRKIWEKEEINRKWAETTWAKKISAREKRAKLNDFDRFKLMKAKQSRNKLIRERVGRLRKTAKKNPPKVKKITRKKKTKK